MTPAAKIGVGNIITIYADTTTATNYFGLFKAESVSQWGYFNSATFPAITPGQAFRIDSKIDDGVPFTGTVAAIASTTALATAAAPANSVCVSNASGNPYNINESTGAGSVACALRIRVK